MDDLEKKIIRRKKGAFMEHLQINEDFLDELRVKQIIPSDVIDSMQTDKINGARVTKLLEFILSTTEPFETLAAILLKDYSWLSRDVEAEILAEKGTLVIDEDLLRETGMLVHRKFGSSKRLCETDKREIQELMALKLQIAKGEFEQEVGKVKEDLNKQTQINIKQEKLAARMLDGTKRFIKDHDSQLNTHAHGLLTTKNALQLSLAEMAYSSLEKYENYSDYILNRFASILAQRDTLLTEREKCLKILEVDVDIDLPLNAIVRDRFEKKAKEIEGLKDQCRVQPVQNPTNGSDNAYVIKRLNGKISDMETTLEEKDEKINELEEKLEKLKSVTLSTLQENRTTEESNGHAESENLGKRRASTGNFKKKTTTKRGSVPTLSKSKK